MKVTKISPIALSFFGLETVFRKKIKKIGAEKKYGKDSS